MNQDSNRAEEPEFRIDPLSGAGVIYAPGRAHRANAFVQEPLQLPVTESCPFCPGHEQDTPEQVYRWPAEAAVPWQIRVVPNRYPVVSNGPFPPLPEDAPSTFGHHEVLIETPRHDDHWLSMDISHLAQVLEAIAHRITYFATDPRSQNMMVFKNVGTRAGATLAHPHLQIVTMNYLPFRVATELFDVEANTDQLMGQVLKERKLVVHEADGFLTICPPVSRVPYELWIMPVQRKAYTELSADGYHSLAVQLQDALRRLVQQLGRVAHNILWRLPPIYEDHLPWRIEILPRLTTFAGLELLSDLYVNPVLPEVAAMQLVKQQSFDTH